MTRPKVNVDNFARAETHRMFADLQRDAGGVNRLFHNRAPAPIDRQTVIRMNRDTLYSFAVVDISAGAALVLPDAGDRYLSAMVINEDHYINRVIHDPGRPDLTVAEFGSEHVAVGIRTLADARDADELAAVSALQDEMSVEAGAGRAFAEPDDDVDSLDRTRQALLALASGMDSFVRSFGRREEVDPVHHLISTAAGWGGLPDSEALYIGVSPGLPADGSTSSPSARCRSTASGRSRSTTPTASSSPTNATPTASTTSPPRAIRTTA